MSFPTVGSWISEIQNTPNVLGITNLKFTASYTTGSSNVEYAIYDSANTVSLVDFTTATNGLNTIPITGSINENYRVYFRMIGYPSLGFAPVVSGFSIELLNVGAQLQTLNLGSDVLLSTTKFTKAYVLPEGSYSWNLTGSVSSDNGSSWTPINTFGLEFDLTSTTGSECLIRLNDTTGSVVLNKLNAYFHTSDVV